MSDAIFFYGAVVLVGVGMSVVLFLAENEQSEDDTSEHHDTNPHASN